MGSENHITPKITSRQDNNEHHWRVWIQREGGDEVKTGLSVLATTEEEARKKAVHSVNKICDSVLNNSCTIDIYNVDVKRVIV